MCDYADCRYFGHQQLPWWVHKDQSITYHTNHIMFNRHHLQLLHKLCLRKLEWSATHLFLCCWWVYLVTAKTLHKKSFCIAGITQKDSSQIGPIHCKTEGWFPCCTLWKSGNLKSCIGCMNLLFLCLLWHEYIYIYIYMVCIICKLSNNLYILYVNICGFQDFYQLLDMKFGNIDHKDFYLNFQFVFQSFIKRSVLLTINNGSQ